MERLFIIILVGLFCTACGTGEGQTTLDVSIIEQPAGGTAVNSVAATFDIKRDFKDESTILQTKGEPKDITLEVEWWWESGDRATREMVYSDTYTVTSDDERVRSTYSAGSGYILLNYYYAKVRWTDDLGQQQVETYAAYCSSPNNKTNRADGQKISIISQ